MVKLALGFLFSLTAICYAQSDGTIRGSVLDPSGAAISGALVQIQNPVSHFDQTTKTDSQGHFEFDNVPYNNYHLTASAARFQSVAQDVDLRSPVPADLNLF